MVIVDLQSCFLELVYLAFQELDFTVEVLVPGVNVRNHTYVFLIQVTTLLQLIPTQVILCNHLFVYMQCLFVVNLTKEL